MTAIEDLFTELMFGPFGWVLAMTIIVIMVLGASRNKYLGVLFIPFSIFLGILYLENTAISDNLLWVSVLFFLTAIVLIFQGVKR